MLENFFKICGIFIIFICILLTINYCIVNYHKLYVTTDIFLYILFLSISIFLLLLLTKILYYVHLLISKFIYKYEIKKLFKKFLKFNIVLSLYLIVIMIILSGIRNDDRVWIANRINMYIPILAKVDYYDNHGGFFGDGNAIAKVYFSDKNASIFLEKIKNNNHWYELPLDSNIQDSMDSSAEYLEIEKVHVNKGYWYFYDRHHEAIDRYNINDAFSYDRHSSNYTVAIFDTDNNILYFYEHDT